jgi:hypothetical protein
MRLLAALAVAAAIAAVPPAAGAAELGVPAVKRTKVVVHTVKKRKVVRVVRPHWGYYFHRWGWRYGPSGRTWIPSRFVFADIW